MAPYYFTWTPIESTKGKTALHFAAEYGHANVCKLIMDTQKTNWDKNPSDCHANKHNSETPFQLAVMNGRLEVCFPILC